MFGALKHPWAEPGLNLLIEHFSSPFLTIPEFLSSVNKSIDIVSFAFLSAIPLSGLIYSFIGGVTDCFV